MTRNDILTKLDKFNLSLGLFNVIALITSIIISIWSINKTEDIADRSGAFDKGEIVVSFDKFMLGSNSPTEVYYGMNFNDSLMNFVILPITLNNTGKKSVENINAIIEYPHISNLAIQDSMYKFEGARAKQLNRRFYRSEPFDQINYELQTINPNNSIQIPDLFYIPNPTQEETVIQTVTKDNKKLDFKVKCSFSYSVNFHLTAKDILAKSYRVLIKSINIPDKDKLINKILTDKLKQREKESISDHFFVIIPTLKEKFEIKDQELRCYDSREIFLCQFDKDYKALLVTDKDGNKNIIKAEK